ncbi:MAG: S-methyl-5-thioribose-1-phosphate isomerase [Verrucomicrobiota bacterium]|nr:S-methyl-5-thioribose-1-phosphate isomerase [Verrucomicrobiota bacterium]
MLSVKTVEWVPDTPGRLLPGRVRILDQTLLPDNIRFIETSDIEVVWRAIRTVQVRGAPAIGVAAAMGVAAAAQRLDAPSATALVSKVAELAGYLATARPTAVNLFWALDRMKRAAARHAACLPAEIKETLVREAIRIRDEDAAMCRAIGEHGVALLHDGDTILTHCNAGALATAEFGTALAPVYVAMERGWTIRVFADETRPLLQGARLTAWELGQAGADVTLICDNVAAQVMKESRIQAVLVGADRIAANGDTANKIGTYGVAVLAKAHGIPFYVLAPSSSFDFSMPTGATIPIEERGAEEVTSGFGKRIAPREVKVYSPAFDVTPADLIAAIVCEKGIAKPDYRLSLQRPAGGQALPAE